MSIDELMHQDAVSWNATQPPIGDFEDAWAAAASRDAPRPRARSRAVLGAVAAVAVVVTGLVIAVGPSKHDRSRPVRPAPAAVRCQDDFTVVSATYAPVPPARAMQNMVIQLSYRGTRPCSISPYGPLAELIDARGMVVGSASHTTMEGRREIAVNLTDWVIVRLRWTPACSAAAGRVATVKLHLGGLVDPAGPGVVAAVPGGYRPPCDRAALPGGISGFVEGSSIIAGFGPVPTDSQGRRKAQGLTPFLQCGMTVPPPGGDVGLPASLAIVNNARSVQLTVRNDGQSIVGIETNVSVVLIDDAGLIIATDNIAQSTALGVSALAAGSSAQRVEQPVFDVCPHAPGVHRTPTPGDYFAVGVFISGAALSSAITALTIHPDRSLSS